LELLSRVDCTRYSVLIISGADYFKSACHCISINFACDQLELVE
jgi:hypothetical protein